MAELPRKVHRAQGTLDFRATPVVFSREGRRAAPPLPPPDNVVAATDAQFQVRKRMNARARNPPAASPATIRLVLATFVERRLNSTMAARS